MIIYKDILTGDEIISDTYDLKDIDDVVYEVDCKLVTKGAVNVNTGANARDPNMKSDDADDADAGEAEPVDENQPEPVNDIIDGFRLNPKGEYPTKEIFRDVLFAYLKALSEKLKQTGVEEARIKEITSGIKKYAPKIAKKIKDYEPYVGESLDVEDQMALYLNYREDGKTPYFTIWKHGLTEMKV